MNFIKRLPGTTFDTFEALGATERRHPWAAAIIIVAVLTPAVVVAIHRWWRGR